MSLLPESAYKIQLPKLYKVNQIFDATMLPDVEPVLVAEMQKPAIRKLIKPGMRIALGVGSRGIHQIDRIVRIVGEQIKKLGAEPFIVPAMGSHGRGESSGQLEILASYNITPESMDMPIQASMEVVSLGKTAGNVEVFFDKNAYEADLVVPICRIKPHTDFKGDIESGICKMLAIGFGKHEGCSRLHQEGFQVFSSLIPEVAEVIISKAPIGFGVGIIENAYDKTLLIEAVPAKAVLTREPELLRIAKTKMPALLLKEIDVLLIDKIGKDISGAGMDPNIVGRTTKGKIPGFSGPNIQRIVLGGISTASHGNACGMGLADYLLESAKDEIDFMATYTNCVGSGNPEAGRLPVLVKNEYEGVLASLRTAIGIQYDKLKIVKIYSTLQLSEIRVSEALLPECSKNPGMQVSNDFIEVV